MINIFHISNLPFALLLLSSFFFLFFQGFLESHDVGHSDAHELDTPWLGFLNVGHLPVSILLILFLFNWGASGLILHLMFVMLLKSYQVWELLLSLVLSILPAAVLTRLLSNTFARFFQDSSAVTTPDELVGCSGTVISGSIPAHGASQMGRAHVYTAQGTLLQIACQTQEGCESAVKQETIFVTAYHPEKRYYSVLKQDSSDFISYLSSNSAADPALAVEQSYAQVSNLNNKNMALREDSGDE
jgi:hypothetical protein